MENKKCTVSNTNLEVVNYLKHRTVCKTCYKKNGKRNNSNTSHHNQKSKVLITIPKTIEPQSSSNSVLELLEVTFSRIPRSTRT